MTYFKCISLALQFSLISPAWGGLNAPASNKTLSSDLPTTPATERTDSAKIADKEKAEIVAKQTKIETDGLCLSNLNRMKKMMFGTKNSSAAECALAKTMPQCQFKCEPSAPESPRGDDKEKPVTTPAISPVARVTPLKKPTVKPEAEDAGSADPEEDESPTPSPTAKTAKKPTAKTNPTAKADPEETSPEKTEKEKEKESDTETARKPAEDSEAEASDLSACRSLSSEAASACNYSDSDSYGSSSSSMAGSCEEMQNAGIQSGTAKNDAAKKCSDKWSNCARTCKSSADKYSESDNWSNFNSEVSTCIALADKVTELTNASSQSAHASKGGTACNEASSQSPQSMGGEGGASEAQKASAAQAAACAANPASAECQSQSQYAAARAATAGFNETQAGRGSFDTADTSGLNVGPIIGSAGGDGAPGGGGLKNGTIANNSGGAMLGGGGGGGGAGGRAGSGGGGGGLVSNALAALTDIEKGFLGGGYSQLLNGENPWSNEPPDPATVNRALASLGVQPIDLRRYLPGGDLAPKFVSPADIRQFHAPGVDLFSRIHDRYWAKCLLGELVDCR